MSVKKEASGRRSVQVEVEVPGTPEEVWQAIATGPGVSSWFVPTEVEQREGGAVVSHFGPGMDAIATATAWDPPRRFAAESQDLGPSAPLLATQWIVEARWGGVCVVRVVHSLFASSDDWDDQLESIESGWPTFFRILRLYLTHFRGQPCSTVQLVGVAPEPGSKAWETLIGSLGLAGATMGQRWNTPAGVPPLAGFIEQIGEGKNHLHALLRLDEPIPGIASLIANTVGDKVYPQVSFYLYGDRAASVVARDEPLWHAWMNDRFRAAD
ncbi:MAG: SRPBCC domain-containing protein [Planctomycetia bacterium]|nr:SRPBCC domain-containing protein [Planctomycetia bacterium]